jgi:hypothetical protein
MIAAVCCLLTGCTAEQIDRADRAVADANLIGGGVVEFVTGPAGALFPPIVRTIAELLGLSLAGALAVWQAIRAKLLKQTGAAIVNAIESLDPGEKLLVKEAVKAEMKEREIYSKANAVVDSLKAV